MTNLEQMRGYAITINEACKTIQRYGKDSEQGKQAAVQIITCRRLFIRALTAFPETDSEG